MPMASIALTLSNGARVYKSERPELSEQTCSYWLLKEGRAQSLAVAGKQIIVAPTKVCAKPVILLLQRHIRNGSGIGVDSKRHA